MKVGFIGLGKLGMPCAVAMQMRGHEVMGYDVNESLMNNKPRPYKELGPGKEDKFNWWLHENPIEFGNLKEIAEHAEIIFVGVQTPHKRQYEGTTRIPAERVDFDYSYLKVALMNLGNVIKKDTVVVIISTVLPETFRIHLEPILRRNKHIKACYNPFFIAMGTTMWDFLNPEFVLFGVHDEWAAKKAEKFYRLITNAPFYKTSVENAELIKVAYNTFIGMKIAFVNSLMEICHKIDGCNVDEVTNALKLAKHRLISPNYLSAGMGDGGGCHPRDNIALSWLSKKLDLSFDWFENVMFAREKQTEWLADLIEEQMDEHNINKCVILGYSFKAESNITTGSPALLLELMLRERAIVPEMWDPYVDAYPGWPDLMTGVEYKTPPDQSDEKAVFFIGTKHLEFRNMKFAPGSVVIDPWRYLDKNESDITYIGVGGD